MIAITVNGRPLALPSPLSIASLLVQLGYQDSFVAVALDHEHVRRQDFDGTVVGDRAAVEILAPMAGG